MMKVVLKVDIYDDRTKQKAMKTVSGLSGVESVSVDMEDKKLILTGDTDPVHVVGKLRKWCHAEIISVGPAKEDKKEGAMKTDDKELDPLKFYETHAYYYPTNPPQHYQGYYVRSVDEYPNTCVIC